MTNTKTDVNLQEKIRMNESTQRLQKKRHQDLLESRSFKELARTITKTDVKAVYSLSLCIGQVTEFYDLP